MSVNKSVTVPEGSAAMRGVFTCLQMNTPGAVWRQGVGNAPKGPAALI
jgi:hypothetical protein